jgi:hypothetical protein
MASTSNKGIPSQKVLTAFSKAYILTDYTIHNNLNKRHEFRKSVINEDESLTQDEKTEVTAMLSKRYDYDKIIYTEGDKRVCENCKNECLATLYCEHCIRNYLMTKFSEWTSGKNDIDDLIQKCQLESIGPNKIIEWIPYTHLEGMKYLTKGGISEIYLADWIYGHYNKWNSEKQQLERYGREKIVVKRLKNVKSANRSWFEEVCNLN